ncbi:MAG: 3'-5' exoribonuclease [archaeon]|nr:3'-5' exoribonuclease [archaeon]
MKYYIDTEFIEYPCTIDLISIGIKCEDGREFYAISTDFDSSKASDWVKENVISKLPEPETCNLWMPKVQIPTEILSFIGDDKPEFWAYFADYDWVVFCWLFGTMINLPKGWPMYCRDLKQLLDESGKEKIKEHEGAHNAIVDARWNKTLHEHLLK